MTNSKETFIITVIAFVLLVLSFGLGYFIGYNSPTITTEIKEGYVVAVKDNLATVVTYDSDVYQFEVGAPIEINTDLVLSVRGDTVTGVKLN